MTLTDKRLPVALSLSAALICAAYGATGIAIGLVLGTVVAPLVVRWMR